MKKQTNILAVAVLAFGLTACGGDEAAPIHHNPHNNGVHIPNNPTSNFGLNAAESIIQSLQHEFGNMRTNQQTKIGSQILGTGTHSWRTLYNMVESEARKCANELAHCSFNSYWGSYNTVGGLSNVNFSVFMDYLEMDRIDDTDVIYDRYPNQVFTMAHAVDLLVGYLSSSFSQAWSQWGYGGYYPVYHYGYYPYYGGNNLNIGFGYNNGNWGLNIGGGFNF